MSTDIDVRSEKKVSLLCNNCQLCYRAPESQSSDNCEYCDSKDIHVISDEDAIKLVKEALAL